MAAGAPDFGSPLHAGNAVLFPVHERPGRFLAVPLRLDLATAADGTPAFDLRFIRGPNPMLPPKPYAVLDLRVTPGPPGPDALGVARSRRTDAVVDPAAPAGGWLRLDLVSAAPDPVGDLGRWRALGWNGLGRARSSMRISTDTAELLRRGIEAETLVLSAGACIEVEGVAPRLPLRVHFNPSALVGALVATAGTEAKGGGDAGPGGSGGGGETGDAGPGGSSALTRSALEKAIASPDVRGDLTITDDGLEGDPWDAGLAAAVLDHLVSRYGRRVFPDDPSAEPGIAFDPGDLPDDLDLDLSKTRRVGRLFRLTFDPLTQVRRILAGRDAGTLTSTVAVPALRSGHLLVQVSANLPEKRPGILQIGAVLSAPPHPPSRVDRISETVRFTPPADTATVSLRFAPDETQSYRITPFVIVRDGEGGVKRLDADPMPGTGDSVLVQPGDFPVTLVPVAVDPDLLAIADVHGEYHPPGKSGTGTVAFDLTTEGPSVAIPVIAATDAAGDGDLVLRVVARDDGTTLTYGPVAAGPVRLGLQSFSGYGPHEIQIHCAPKDDGIVAVDLIPEKDVPGPDTVSVLTFQKKRTSRSWSWLAASPFHPGYRYRMHRDDPRSTEGWSDVQPPGAPLRVAITEPATSEHGAPS